jgi:hypothetical protein
MRGQRWLSFLTLGPPNSRPKTAHTHTTQAHLHFTIAAPAARHYALLPRAVGQLAARLPFDDVELSLTQGRWHHGSWGAPVLPAKPVGAVR